MPSLVKTNSLLAAGNLQLLDYSTENQADGTLAISADFLCLPQFQERNIKALRPNADAPPLLMSNKEFVQVLQSFGAVTTPLVRSCRAQTSYGLTTISVVLGVITQIARANQDGGASVTREVTTSTDLKSLTGSVSSADGAESFSFSFDYYAQSVTVEGVDTNLGMSENPIISRPFNIRSGLNVGDYIGTFVSQTSRTYRNNVGVMKTQTTYANQYIQTKFVI